MSDLTLKIQFFSPWHCGSGLSAGADTDALVIKNPHGLPFVPGKTIKGLVREAVEDYVALKGENINLEEAFGVEASPEDSSSNLKGYLYFTNGELSREEAHAIISTQAQDFLYINKVETAIAENGITQEHSLRTIETTVPCTLYAQIMHVDEALANVIEPALGLIKHMGVERNRGLGRCLFTIEKGGKK